MKFHSIISLPCLLLIVCVGLSRSEDIPLPPVITHPRNTNVSSDQDGTLACKFASAVTNCFWNKDGGQIDMGDRYAFAGTPDADGDCSIRITKSDIRYDDGIWQCGLPGSSSSGGLKSDSAKYTVYAAPNPPQILSAGTVLANGSDLLIDDFLQPPMVSCVSTGGNPAATLKFMKDNVEQSVSYATINETSSINKTYTGLLNLTAPIDGSWENTVLTCVANHPALNASQVSFVYIHRPAAPASVNIMSDLLASDADTIHADTKDTIILFCLSDGYPQPDSVTGYSWERRDSDSGAWSSFSSTGQNLTFMAANGQYSCLASNGISTPQRSLRIIKVDTSILSASQSSLSLAEQTIVPQDASTANVGTIIAVVVVFVVLIVVVVAGVYMLYRKRMWCFKDNNAQIPPNPQENGDPENGQVGAPPIRKTDDTDDTKNERDVLMQDDNEKKNVANVRTDVSPKETTNGIREIEYTTPQFGPGNVQAAPHNVQTGSPKTEYAAIVTPRAYGIQ